MPQERLSTTRAGIGSPETFKGLLGAFEELPKCHAILVK